LVRKTLTGLLVKIALTGQIEGYQKDLFGIVEYSKPHFWLSIHNEKYGASDFTWENWYEEVEVIGNIYDNPELISKAAK
jgi:YopX protein